MKKSSKPSRATPPNTGHKPSQNGRAASGLAAAAFDYPAGVAIDAHRHETHQLVYAASGVMNVRTARGTWIVPPNRALWVPARVEHAIRTIGPVAMRTLYLERARLPRTLGSADCAVVDVSPLLRELIVALVDEQRRTHRSDRGSHLAALVLAELRTLRVQPLHVPLPRDQRLRRVCEAMQADPGSTKTIAQWGAGFGLSAKTIARDFAADLGMTVGRWRQQVRLMQALERIATGEAITTVAMDLGYSSASSFTAMFRKALGSTPSAYFQ